MTTRNELVALHPVFKDEDRFPDDKIEHWDAVAQIAFKLMNEGQRNLFVAHQMALHGHITQGSEQRWDDKKTYVFYSSRGGMPEELNTTAEYIPGAGVWNETPFGQRLHRTRE